MAKKFPTATKMTDEALKDEYYNHTDHRFFSLRTRRIACEMTNRGIKIDKSLIKKIEEK